MGRILQGTRNRRGHGRRAGTSAGPWVLILLSTVLFLSCSPGKKQEEAQAPIPVVVEKVRHINDFRTVPVSGSVVSPDAPSNVSFLIPGKVVNVGPREGEYVKKGQFLASIDPLEYRLAVEAAASETERARVASDRAGDEYERMKLLYESKSLAPNDFRKFKAAHDAALQQVEQAKAGEGVSRKRLSDTTLTAPVHGFVTRRAVEPGETASPGRPVFEISRLDPVEIMVGVPETDIYLVKVGQTATVTVPALPGQTFSGKVRVINVAADPSTRTYMTRITVANPAHALRLGMVAEVRIRSDRKIDMMALTGDAVVRDSRGVTSVFVYYPDRGRAYAKRVETGTAYDRDVEIKSGLAGRELVVTSGQDKLREGSPVSVKSQSAGQNGVPPGAR